ncbi:MAG: hypothetical protein IPM17_17775 [Verrucomicrobia bacterium]|nr:hypothetical protein [Verrucomicrobiota bacterium]
METRPDGHKLTVYCNYAGQPILKVLEEYSGGSPTGNKWYEYFKYDGQGRVIQRGTSEAVASYSEASPGLVTLNSSVGLIRVYEYYPAQSSSITGEAPSRLRYEKVKQGNTGTEIKVREWQYATRTAGGKTVYPVWKRIEYRSDSGRKRPGDHDLRADVVHQHGPDGPANDDLARSDHSPTWVQHRGEPGGAV